uniref:Uncharacterized protein n=1 Tax=Arundo donax TaxID=35708 RepID=A0A0A9B3H5_ARUDO
MSRVPRRPRKGL